MTTDQLAIGLSILGIMTCHQGYLFYSLRDKIYLQYVIFLASFCFLPFASLSGQLTWPIFHYVSNELFLIGLGFTLFGGIQFSQKWLEIQKITPRWHTILSWMEKIILGGGILIGISYSWIDLDTFPQILEIIIAIAIGTTLLMIGGTGGVYLVKGHPISPYFIIGWAGFVLGCFFKALLISSSEILILSQWFLLGGVVIGILFWSLGLTHDSRQKQRNKEQEQEAETHKLESEVKAQTHVLEQVFIEQTKRAAEIAQINEVTRTINATLNLEQVMSIVMEVLHRLFPFDRVAYALVEEDGEFLRIHNIYGTGITSEIIEQIKQVKLSLVTQKSIYSASFSCKKPLCTSSISQEAIQNFSEGEKTLYQLQPIKSILVCPLEVRHEVIGFIIFAHTESEIKLAQSEMETIQRYVTQVANAVQNVQLFQLEQSHKVSLQEAMQELQKTTNHIEKELRNAATIQKGVLPQTPYYTDQLSISAHYQAMSEVGGDIFNILPLSDGRTGILIADAMGHGIPAALTAMMSQVSFTNHLHESDSPKKIFRQINQFIHSTLESNSFLTAFLAIIDANGKVTYSNANHPAPLVLHKGQVSIEPWKTNGAMIGVDADERVGDTFEEKTATLQSGDRIFFYTDGLPKGADKAGKRFGKDKLYQILRSTREEPPEEVKSQLLYAWNQHVKGAKMRDDMVFMIMDIQ